MGKFQSDHSNIFDFKEFLTKYLNFFPDKEDELQTVSSIKDGVEFKGATLWMLIIAIFMASLGLNVNSTAVIIGAMLISPLMGPIMGVGLSVGLNDFELLKKSIKSYLVATAFSVGASTIFFLISPVVEGQSELLARTSPTIYDVFIALLGGMAGFLALATTKKGSVIPGVAIATALMPPLCTAGFGLATGNLVYFLGAFYLYFINSVFICLATYIGVRVFHFKRLEFTDKVKQRNVKRYIVAAVILAMVPSVYLTARILRGAFFERSANEFIQEQLTFEGAQVVDSRIDGSSREKSIKIVLVGKQIPDSLILLARAQMPSYGLSDTKLEVLQGAVNAETLGQVSVQSKLIEQLYEAMEENKALQKSQTDSLTTLLKGYTDYDDLALDLAKEIKIFYPQIQSFTLSPAEQVSVDSIQTERVIVSVVKTGKQKLSSQQKLQLEEWFKARTKAERFHLVVE